MRRKADAKTGRDERDQGEGIVAAIGDVAGQVVLGKHLGKIALGIRQVLARERDDPLIPEVLDTDFAQTRQFAVLGDGQQIFVVRHREEPQGTDVFHRPDEAEIDLAAFQVADDIVGRSALDLQLDIGKLAGDLRQEGGQDADGGRVDGADPDLALQLAGDRACRFGGDIDVTEDTHSAAIESPARHRQLDPACRADKQLHAQLPLQRLDLRRQRRLGDMHTRCRPSEMQLLGHRNEIGELAQFHEYHILLVMLPTYRTWTRVVCHEQTVGMEPFATNLRLRAERLGISNAEVARRADLSDRRYGNYVSGRREPDLATLLRISKVLGVSIDELVGSTVDNRTGTKEDLFQERITAALRTLGHNDLQMLAIMIEALAMARTHTAI